MEKTMGKTPISKMTTTTTGTTGATLQVRHPETPIRSIETTPRFPTLKRPLFLLHSISKMIQAITVSTPTTRLHPTSFRQNVGKPSIWHSTQHPPKKKQKNKRNASLVADDPSSLTSNDIRTKSTDTHSLSDTMGVNCATT